MNNRSADLALSDFQALLGQKHLLLATVCEQGLPECSTAPFIRDQDGCFYVFVSELALHCRNMLTTQRAAVLLVAPEEKTDNHFARQRLSFQCQVDVVSKDDEHYAILLRQFETEFGKTVSLLRNLNDFNLLRLSLEKGRFVAGFGQVYPVDIKNKTLIFDT